ncbi:MAG TPA: ribonuclease HI [Bacteroidia bacterium]|nr:ribonuclease HI [Bacteroidia bacterium]
MSDAIHIYTDGAASGNPGPGGFGVVMLYKEKRKEISEGFKHTTNNRMELMAVIVALEHLKNLGSHVSVYSDSKYVVDSIEKKWIDGWIKKNFKNVKNVDLWLRFLALYKKHHVKFKWVKGHADNVENNRCDVLAVQAYKQPNLKPDVGYQSAGIL